MSTAKDDVDELLRAKRAREEAQANEILARDAAAAAAKVKSDELRKEAVTRWPMLYERLRSVFDEYQAKQSELGLTSTIGGAPTTSAQMPCYMFEFEQGSKMFGMRVTFFMSPENLTMYTLKSNAKYSGGLSRKTTHSYEPTDIEIRRLFKSLVTSTMDFKQGSTLPEKL